jgi:hypothetical protein
MKPHLRQGDILFIKVDKLPEKRTPKADRVVALGEVTGHSHRVVGGNLFESDFGMFVESDGDTEIVHDEHGPITLPEGIFQVRRQVEFTESAAAPRPVRD